MLLWENVPNGKSRVSNVASRDSINNARDVTFENCLDLMQIYED